MVSYCCKHYLAKITILNNMTNIFGSKMDNSKNNNKISNLTFIWNKPGPTKQIHYIRSTSKDLNRILDGKTFWTLSYQWNIWPNLLEIKSRLAWGCPHKCIVPCLNVTKTNCESKYAPISKPYVYRHTDKYVDAQLQSFLTPNILHICAKLQLQTSNSQKMSALKLLLKAPLFFKEISPHTATTFAMKSASIHIYTHKSIITK